MKRAKKYLSMILVAAIAVSMLGTVAYAAGTYVSGGTITVSEDNMGELSVRSTVTHYLRDRADYLRNDVNDFATAVPAIVADESSHRENLQTNNITFIKSEITIDSVHCDEDCADVIVTETVTYAVNKDFFYENVNHEITVYPNENDEPIVASDAYCETYSGFYSCSFVLPPEESLETMAAAGSGYCIINVAKGEIGYTESGTNVTKYGSWYGLQDEWCAMFVSWCANHANISTSIIPLTASAPGMKDTFSQKGRFYLSQSQGGSTAPMAGDLFFQGTSSNNIYHVGIITSVDSNNIYVVDGNCENKVNSHSISRSASNFVGFARPAYASNTHTPRSTWSYNASSHWQYCANCGIVLNKSGHSFSIIGGYYQCACGYRKTQIVEPYVGPEEKYQNIMR